MTPYIALLRGINIGRHCKMKMVDMCVMICEMGFKGVQTYIQSGNVVFVASNGHSAHLANRISRQIEKTFGNDVPMIICTSPELSNIRDNMFFEEKGRWKRYITFLSHQPDQAQQNKMEEQSSNVETFRVGEEVVYAQVNKQTDEKPLFSGSFVQKQLDIPATNRNLRSVNKILALASPTE